MYDIGEEKKLFLSSKEHSMNTCCTSFLKAKVECSQWIALYAGCFREVTSLYKSAT